MQVFFTYINIYVLKQEKSGMDDFEIQKNFGSKGQILLNFSMFLTDTVAKMSQIFLHIFLCFRKKLHLLAAKGSTPPKSFF